MRCYIDGELYDSDGYDSLRDAVRRQKEITSDFRQLARETEANYRDGLVDSLKAAQDSAATGSPEASVFKCLRRHIKTPGKVAAVAAALRDAGLCQ